MKTQIKKNYLITSKNHTIIIFYYPHSTCFILLLVLVMDCHARENNLILL